ncbi:MAG: hypothetical protein FWD82_04510 [Defluviitaleaceae bacterium]|nr:hypothetical protein [Defluviitaleaceae bacterium]
MQHNFTSSRENEEDFNYYALTDGISMQGGRRRPPQGVMPTVPPNLRPSQPTPITPTIPVQPSRPQPQPIPPNVRPHPMPTVPVRPTPPRPHPTPPPRPTPPRPHPTPPRPTPPPRPHPTPTPRPPHGGNHNHRPTTPPPRMIPPRSSGFGAVDGRAISRCMFRTTYVWLRNGREFWFYPVFVGGRSVAGFRWDGFNWRYIGFDLNTIDFFSCR